MATFIALTNELRGSRNKAAAIFFIVASCCGITWPKNERGEPLLPARSTLGYHQVVAAVAAQLQCVYAFFEHASAAQAAGRNPILDANNALSSDGCSTNGKQFESIVMKTADGPLVVAIEPTAALGGHAAAKVDFLLGKLNELGGLAKALAAEKALPPSCDGLNASPEDVISVGAIGAFTTDSAAVERKFVELLGEEKAKHVAGKGGAEDYHKLPADGSARALAQLRIEPGGGVQLRLAVFARPLALVAEDAAASEEELFCDEEELVVREARVKYEALMAKWRLDNMTKAQVERLSAIVWINCLMHSTVHAVDGMMDELNARLIVSIGDEWMSALRTLQTGAQAKEGARRPRPRRTAPRPPRERDAPPIHSPVRAARSRRRRSRPPRAQPSKSKSTT